MVKHRLFAKVFVAGITAAFLVPAVNADPVKKASEVTFTSPVEIPGMVLQAGTYVIKVPDPVTHSDMVGFYNTDQSYLYKLVRTIPRYRLEVTDKTALTYEERVNGAPAAIKTWFYPDEYWGKEFVYEKAEMLTVAEAPEVVAPPFEEEGLVPEVAEAPAPAPAPEAVVEEVPAPIEVAEAAPPAAPEEIAAAPVEELPKTGTSMPLFALFGAASLVLGGALRLAAAKR